MVKNDKKKDAKSNNLPYIFQNVTLSSHFLILQDFCNKIILFSLYWTTSFLFQSKFAEDFRCIILDRIKRVLLFGGNFYLGLLKTLLQNFYYKNFFVSYFGCKSQIEPINIKIHTHKILLMQLNLVLEIKCSKNGMEKLHKHTFFKINVTFPSFFALYS